MTLPPDQAVVSLTVETYDGHSSSAAVGSNSDIYNRVASAITALGVSRDDISFSSYYVSYTAPPNNRSGYTVDRTLSVKTNNLGLAGRIVDAATSAGATRINGVTFGLADTTAAATQAMQRAVADATAKATAIAAAAHLHIVGIASVNLGYSYVPQPLARMATAVHGPTTFETGNTTVSQTVNVVFLAKP